MKVEITCAYCGETAMKEAGSVTRAKAKGAPLYCDRTCAGQGRRKHKSPADKVKDKRLYDIEYRRKNQTELKAKKAAAFQRDYDPVQAAVYRKSRMHLHVKYCQQPTYQAWKREYDRKYRAKKDYGEFWESALLIQNIETEVLSRTTRYDIMLANGTIAKNQKRKRAYAKINHKRFDSGEFEERTLGGLARNSGGPDGWWSG